MTDQIAARPGPSPASRLLWGLASTALLAAYIAWNMGWVVAVAAVVGVFVHEYGHVLAINALGTEPGRIHIIPFFGGAATMRTPPTSEFRGVLIGLAGPVFGLLAIVPFYVAFAATGDGRWIGGALFIAGITLLTRAPVPPLDGSKALGPALARIHPWVERGVLLVLAAFALDWSLSHGQIPIAVIVGLGAARVFLPGPMRPASTPLTLVQWGATIGLYVLALALCVAAGVTILNLGAGFSAEGLRSLVPAFGAR